MGVVKPFEMPEEVLAEEACVLRTPSGHSLIQPVKTRLAMDLAGASGEKEVMYWMQHLPSKDFFVFHNLKLYDRGSFQMDIVVLTVYYILLLEVKSYLNEVFFNKYNQLIHTKTTGETFVYPSPIGQVERHRLQLMNWLVEKGFPSIPVVPFVVFSSDSTLIQSEMNDENVLQKVISGSNILPKIRTVSQQYRKSYLNSEVLQRLSSKLLSSHFSYRRNLLEQYGISQTDLIKGVLCPTCHQPMERVPGHWICAKCRYRGVNDHIRALNDYFLLIDDHITIKQARDFLKLPNRNVVAKLLNQQNYPVIGKTRAKKYKLNYQKLPN